MSPQFVDFDADGHLDIVAGIFDGSPHVALGTAEGFEQPKQILDRDGQRIVMNDFWNFDAKQWDATDRCDAEGAKLAKGHLTSAWAADYDGDGDLDLLLGDHKGGHVLVRINEGSRSEPAYATTNTVVPLGGEPLVVPGTVTTLQLADWTGDGKPDLACGSMGDSWQKGAGGGVYVYPGTSDSNALAFGAPITLVVPSRKGGSEPTRPDAGLYMDLADHDGDGDLDLLVGGYSQWTPPARALNEEETQRVKDLRGQIAELNKETTAYAKEMTEAIKGLDAEAAKVKRAEIAKEWSPKLTGLAKQRTPLQKELDELVPREQRVSFVWLYENTSKRASAPGGGK